LVTNQHFRSRELGSKGWLVHPRSGRFVMFDATTLHGVIPGAGHSTDIDSRRITFMCAFWRDIKFRTPNQPKEFCACMPFPATTDTSVSWHRAHLKPLPHGVAATVTPGVAVQPAFVAPVWVSMLEHQSTSLPSYDQCYQGF